MSARPLARARRELARRAGLRTLARAGGDAAHVAAALRRARSGQLAPEEAAWVERIEARRAELEASRATLTIRQSEYTGDPADEALTADETVGDVTRTASKSPHWARVVFLLARELRPRACLELGTCVGLSAAYQAAALELNGDGGRLVSGDASSARIGVARETIDALGLSGVELCHGRFDATLPSMLERHDAFDLAFLDGHHDERATLAYFDLIAPRLSERGVAIVDDIRWSEGMTRAWERLAADARVGLAVDLGVMGLLARFDAGASGVVRVPLG